jgi:uncharacterized protein (DUF885 family)
LSYKIGQLKILELRENASETLADIFSISTFHEKILETGCIPLALLEEKVDGWVYSQL